MGKLAYEELILLDSFIYLDWEAEENELLTNVIYNLMNSENFPYNMKIMGDCAIQLKKSEYIKILQQIMNRPNLQSLKIKNIIVSENGIECACFMDDESNITVVFRGTVTSNEWKDNGSGVYEYDTQEQINALNYINSLEYDNITVTGHSKGGNKAQYVTVLSPKVRECVSVNGQGFSNEFIRKYENKINENKIKIVAINAKYDYINCLLNSICGKNSYIKTEIQLNPVDYHKANILLDDAGNLREETNESRFLKIISNFLETIISLLPKAMQILIANNIIDIVELILCRENGNNTLKTINEVLIDFYYKNSGKYPNIIYPILEILILPLVFWKDFIKIEEEKSKELLDPIIITINERNCKQIFPMQ